MMKNKFVSLFFFLIVTFSASIIGGIVSSKFKDPWYSSIIKPSFNPPDWIFAPVWSLLYFFMAYAIWNVWIKSREKRLIYLYFIHLVFNTTWSVVFFVFHNMVLALLVLIILIALIINLIFRFKRVKMLSAYLMFPYLLWCSFALILNTSLIMLN